MEVNKYQESAKKKTDLERSELAKEKIESELKNKIEVNLINGGQPIYHFIVSVE